MHRSIAAALLLFSMTQAHAEETIVENVDLPGASLHQEVTYSTTRSEYNDKRDSILKKLKAGDASAFVNEPNPWKRVETTATIGIAFKGVGTSSGRKYLRQISASEEALYLFKNQK